MPSERLHKLARRLSVLATLGMFLVLIMGATVTNTGSGQGCGQSWPLCHGKFIPEFAVATAIEYSHRLVTSIEGLIIAALAIVCWIGWRQHREIRILVPLMIFVLLLQSGLGAWAVLAPQEPAVMAAHFGISLTALASVLLTAVFLYEHGGAEQLRNRPLPNGFRPVLFGVIGYIYALVYLGAYVRHTNASLACTDWPLCNGEVFPGFSGPVGVAFMHRLAALGGMLLLAGLLIWTRRYRAQRPDLYWGSITAVILVLLQSLSGALIVWTRLDLFPSLLHAALASLLFGSLSYLCFHVLPVAPVKARSRETAGPRARPGTVGAGSSSER